MIKAVLMKSFDHGSAVRFASDWKGCPLSEPGGTKWVTYCGLSFASTSAARIAQINMRRDSRIESRERADVARA